MNKKSQLKPLICKTVAGDREAFEKLFDIQKDVISYKIRTMTRCYEDTEDVCQKVMLQVYQKINTLKSPEAFSAWLDIIIIRECSRYYRVCDKAVLSGNIYELENCVTDANEDHLPYDYVEKKERSNNLRSAIERLPECSRKMIVLYYSDGMGYKGIADHMGIPVGSVSTGLDRARKKLRKYMRLS